MVRSLVFLFFDWVCRCISGAIVYAMTFVKWVCCVKRNVDGKRVILVCANDLLGDTLIRLPFFCTLRNVFPKDNYHIVVALSPATSGLLSKLPYFDEVISEKVQNCSHTIFWFFGRNGMSNTLKWAFGHFADIYIVCHRYRSYGSDLVHRLCKPAISVAYVASDEYRMFPMTYRHQISACEDLYTRLLKPAVGRHQLDDLNELISMAKGCPVALSMPVRDDFERMLDFSVTEKLPKGYTVLVPGARVEYRRWPINRFAELSNRIGGCFVVVGSKSESGLAQEISNDSNCRIYDLCGKTSLAQLGGVLARAALVVTNETGTATYAAMLGAKTVCILGGGDFGAFFPNPFCTNAVSVFKREPCFGCDWKCIKTDTSCSWTAPCINAISVDDVFSVVRENYSTVKRRNEHAF